MNKVKLGLFTGVIILFTSNVIYADEAVSLPSIQVLADTELREEVVTSPKPFQDDEKVKRLLEHYIMKKEAVPLRYTSGESVPSLNVQVPAVKPDMSQLTPLQRDYVMAVVSGFKSSEPTAGFFKMLEPLGIGRDQALEAIKSGSIQYKFDRNTLDLLLGKGWDNNLNIK